MNTNETYIKINQQEDKWYIIDAKDKNLGRISTTIAKYITW